MNSETPEEAARDEAFDAVVVGAGSLTAPVLLRVSLMTKAVFFAGLVFLCHPVSENSLHSYRAGWRGGER